jgi:hypothetical protein
LPASILLGVCSAGSSVKTGSGQSASEISSSSQNVSTTMPESMKKALEMTDEQYMPFYLHDFLWLLLSFNLPLLL